ncbi:hypothetical protein CR532_02045 [Candidatus Borreliella tachyglossi]|uniref:Uncharacterized protein n=1 Tax=Candidatus Borreliella tachyglossi TaxID=1964448 RepID=A0A2S1LWW1_9SPIR|nr:hypothetical protein [Candidatus Borreliella tachyglossi]AWG42778.1 hypothetical protein CR532_02045 [Candidatus Borreliella tachyglossi]
MYKYPDLVNTDLNLELPEISILEEDDKKFFTDDYYKNLILSDKEIGSRLHRVLLDYLNPKSVDNGDKATRYKQIVSIYWDFLKSIAKNVLNLTTEQKVLFRFAALLPNALGDELKSLISKTIWDNNYNEPFIYFDEWIYGVHEFKVRKLTVDEPREDIKDEDMKKILFNRQDKILANIDYAKSSLKKSDIARIEATQRLKDMFKFLFSDVSNNEVVMDEYEIRGFYSNDVLKPLNFASHYINDLIKANREIVSLVSQLRESKEELIEIENKMQGMDEPSDSTIAVEEVGSLMKANKLTIGSRGNHFPILLKTNVVINPQGFGSRERVMQLVREIESIQPKIFHKNYRGDFLRIVPYFILIPSYGARGICWEPIDIKNRAKGRGKILIPMYAKDLKKAIILGVGDFIWELAKEQASFRWMETGITGQYYEYYTKFIRKGNVKNFFLDDYLLWIDKESKGVQKVEKMVRGVMWRNAPFPKDLKEQLSRKSFVYKDLFDKDKNIEMSDGY